jgi:hypothetical protein
MGSEISVALGLARYRAKQIISERWLASGHRLTEVNLLMSPTGPMPTWRSIPRCWRSRSKRFVRNPRFKNRWGASTSTVHILCTKWRTAHDSSYARRPSAGISTV